MIIVEVEVPMLDKQYDFQIDETISLAEIKSELVMMICQKEQYPPVGDLNRLMLWSMQRGVRLAEERTAEEIGLRTGDRICIL